MKSSENFATEGLSGTYKQVVFSQRAGETIVGKRPKRKKPRSAVQKKIAATFINAATYARNFRIIKNMLMCSKFRVGFDLEWIKWLSIYIKNELAFYFVK